MAKHWMTREQFEKYTVYLQGSFQEYDRLREEGWEILPCQGGCISPNCKGFFFLPLPRTHDQNT